MVHTYSGILLSRKKEWNNAIHNNMDATEILTLSEVGKRKTNIMGYHIYVESNIGHKWTYLQNRNRLIDIENRLVVAKGEEGKGVGWTGIWGLVDANYYMYKQWAPTVQHRGLYLVSWDRPWWKIIWERECIYVWLDHYAVQQKLTQHCNWLY